MSRARHRACRIAFILAPCWMIFAEIVAAETPGGSAVVDRVLDRLERSLVARCLTPDAGRAMSEVVAAGRLNPVLGNELTLIGGDVRGDRIELTFRDQAGQGHAVTLALPGAKAGEPEQKGERFLFYVTPSPQTTPAISATLLAAAVLFDGAIPDTALQRCAGGEGAQPDPRYPRALALASAVIQVLIVSIAVVMGLRSLRCSGKR